MTVHNLEPDQKLDVTDPLGRLVCTLTYRPRMETAEGDPVFPEVEVDIYCDVDQRLESPIYLFPEGTGD